MPLYTEFSSNLYRKFQVAFVHDPNVECQIWRICCNLFLSYADNRNKHTRTHTHIHRDQTLKLWFSDSGELIKCKSIKISISEMWHQKKTFSTIARIWESKNAEENLLTLHEEKQMPENDLNFVKTVITGSPFGTPY